MKIFHVALTVLVLSILPVLVIGQTNKDIQGTWQMISTEITTKDGKSTMDSAHQYLIKTITANRFIFAVYNKANYRLIATGQGTASCDGNNYSEKFEYATSEMLTKQPMVFTYKIEGDKLTYEGGSRKLSYCRDFKKN